MSLPWLRQSWQQLSKQLAEQQLPPSLLIRGEKGLGKLQLAQFVAKTLLCSEQQHQACNRCHSCQLFDAGAHSSVFHFSHDNPKVDDIRALTAWANQTSQLGAYKVAILSDIGALNPASNNALLKTLEEPVANTHFVLINHLPFKPIPTIASRCQLLTINVPPMEQVQQWLVQQKLRLDQYFPLIHRFCNGSPLAIAAFYREQQLGELQSFVEQYKLALNQQPNKLAEQISKDPLKLQWLGHCLLLSISIARGLVSETTFETFNFKAASVKALELAYQDWLDLCKQWETFPGLNLGQQLYPLISRFKD